MNSVIRKIIKENQHREDNIMAYIPSKKFNGKEPKVGDIVILKNEHSSLAGTFEIGTKVQIVGYDALRGFDIRDEFGNTMTECGFDL